jgi:RsiW-degrading membrane proteinase PrsW (M82 family)
MVLYGAAFFSVSVLILAWFARGRRNRGTISLVFLAGLVSGPAAGAAEMLFAREFLTGPGISGAVVKSAVFYMLGVGPIEEAAKFIAVFLAALRRSDFKNSSDGILLAIAAALGFAAGENVLYMFSYGPADTAARLFLGNFGHASFSVYWGYALGVVLHENARFSLVVEGLALAALLHGLYDFLLTLPSPGPGFALLLAFTLIVFFLLFFKKEKDRHRKSSRSARHH